MDIKPLSKREQFNRLAARTVQAEQMARIKAMTRDEKFAELNEYFRIVGQLNLDINELKKDQVMLGLPDDALDQAIAICWALAGKTWRTLPMSSEELKKHIPASDYARTVQEHWTNLQGIKGGPAFSFRKDGKVRLGGLRNMPSYTPQEVDPTDKK
jgi:hypothetical protein